MASRGLFILPHQGLGDHILCAGIYRELSLRYRHTIVPAKANNYMAVKKMLRDIENIQVISYRKEGWVPLHQKLMSKFGYDKLKLGEYGASFFANPNMRLDENFYHQADLPLAVRWESFGYLRDEEKEAELFDLLKCSDSEYVFVHDDESRGFKIDMDRLPSGVKIVRPIPELASKFTPFDYLKVIESAIEIHCMESSFVAMIESFEIKVPKYAHRYARPEAKSNKVFEFTYKSNWKILL